MKRLEKLVYTFFLEKSKFFELSATKIQNSKL